MLWLKVGTTKKNNDPNFIVHYYLQMVETVSGCPKLCRTDRGTENTIMAGIQCLFRRYSNDELSAERAHRCSVLFIYLVSTPCFLTHTLCYVT